MTRSAGGDVRVCNAEGTDGKVYADSFGLTAHMFYRQPGKFVGHLFEQTPGFVPSLTS